MRKEWYKYRKRVDQYQGSPHSFHFTQGFSPSCPSVLLFTFLGLLFYHQEDGCLFLKKKLVNNLLDYLVSFQKAVTFNTPFSAEWYDGTALRKCITVSINRADIKLGQCDKHQFVPFNY
jgi:hypothetical protein